MRRYLFCLFVVIFPLSTVNVRARNNKDQFVFIGKLQSYEIIQEAYIEKKSSSSTDPLQIVTVEYHPNCFRIVYEIEDVVYGKRKGRKYVTLYNVDPLKCPGWIGYQHALLEINNNDTVNCVLDVYKTINNQWMVINLSGGGVHREYISSNQQPIKLMSGEKLPFVNNYFIRDGEYTDLIKNDTTYQITNGVAVPKYGMPVKKYLNGLSKFYDENRF